MATELAANLRQKTLGMMAKKTEKSDLLLAFDTSERVATVTVSSCERLLAQIDSTSWLKKFQNEEKVGKSTALISMIKEVMEEANVEPAAVAAIAMSNGPGTFTGLRVGVVAARMLCYAWKLPVIVVNSLEVSAEKLRRARSLSSGTRVWSAINAQRNQVFAAEFEVTEEGEFEVVTDQGLFERQALVDVMMQGDHATGSGAAAFQDLIESRTGVELPEQQLACCDATGVGMLAHRRLESKDFDELMTAEPIYFRPSAAEEVRMAAEKN